jgi:hypothetical protein
MDAGGNTARAARNEQVRGSSPRVGSLLPMRFRAIGSYSQDVESGSPVWLSGVRLQ